MKAERPEALAVTRRAEIIRETTGCSWESACARAELEAALAVTRRGSHHCRYCDAAEAMPGHEC